MVPGRIRTGIGLSRVARRFVVRDGRDRMLSSYRYCYDPDYRVGIIGFRAVVEAGSGR